MQDNPCAADRHPLRVLTTRPAAQSQQLQHLLAQAGALAVSFPTLEIRTTLTNQDRAQLATKVAECDWAIFQSANAVHCGAQLLPEIRRVITDPPSTRPRLIAIGPATAAALLALGFHPDLLPEIYNSEGILALPELSNIQGQKIAIFYGENPRLLIEKTIQQRGAVVIAISCYQRACPQYDMTMQVSFLKQTNISIITSSSLSALYNLYQLWPIAERCWLLSIPLVVVTERMAQQARTWGWQTILIAANATDQAILDTVLLWWRISAGDKKLFS